MAIGAVGMIGVFVQVTVLRVAFDLDLNRNKESFLMILDWIRYSSNVKMYQEQRQCEFELIVIAFQPNSKKMLILILIKTKSSKPFLILLDYSNLIMVMPGNGPNFLKLHAKIISSMELQSKYFPKEVPFLMLGELQI